METKEVIRNFVKEQISGYALDDTDDFFALGLVSSMFVMQLVAFVEQNFQINIDGADLSFDFFKSVNAITELVEHKLDHNHA